MGALLNIFRKKKKRPSDQFNRSTDYRREYLKHHRGFFGIYICSYCGKVLTRSQMQVDHVYPVNRATTQSSGRFFILLRNLITFRQRKKGVNALWNLTLSCKHCNHIKNDSAGLWTVRGYIGRILFPLMNLGLLGILVYGTYMSITSQNPTKLYYALAVTLCIKFLCRILLSRKPQKKQRS